MASECIYHSVPLWRLDVLYAGEEDSLALSVQCPAVYVDNLQEAVLPWDCSSVYQHSSAPRESLSLVLGVTVPQCLVLCWLP